MRRLGAAGVALLLASCDTAGPNDIAGAIEFTPPASYAAMWEVAEECTAELVSSTGCAGG